MGKLDKFLKSFDEKTLIVTFLNIRYYPIFKIWYKYFRRYKLTNLLVISLDKKVHKVLNNLEIRSILLPINNFENFLSEKIYDFEERNNLMRLWLLRGYLFKKIINEDINLIHCDADAFWIKNIYPLVENLQYDISISINSTGDGLPKVAIRKWGFCLVSGFFMVRSNARTKVFMEKYFDSISRIGDDQMAINKIFLQNNIKWKKKSNIENEGYIKKFKLTVYAINYNIVSRSTKPGIYVFHTYLEGDINKKLKTLKEKLKRVEINK